MSYLISTPTDAPPEDTHRYNWEAFIQGIVCPEEGIRFPLQRRRRRSAEPLALRQSESNDEQDDEAEDVEKKIPNVSPAFRLPRMRKPWPRLREELSWMWDRAGHAPFVLDTFLRWSARTDVFQLSRPWFKFFHRIITTRTLHALLRVSPEQMEQRMRAVRMWTSFDFVEQPSVLLYPWDAVSETELGYRANTLGAYLTMGYHIPAVDIITLLLTLPRPDDPSTPRTVFDQALQRTLRWHEQFRL